MKILNLYAGIGGNRRLWGDEHQIVAVENNNNIAETYQHLWPYDTVIITDAHQYLLEHYSEFDFIWASPPCPTHSRARFGFGVCGHKYKYEYPDMRMYQEIILLKHLFTGRWVIENVIPYYRYLIEPSVILGRHAYWSNFPIPYKKVTQNNMIAGHTNLPKNVTSFYITREKDYLKHITGFDLDKYKGFDKKLALRNCVEPEIGLHILECSMAEKAEQKLLF